CADMVGMRLSALRSLFVRWGSESVWCVVVGKARTHGRRENAILYPPPRSGGGGPPEGWWRGHAEFPSCSTQAVRAARDDCIHAPVGRIAEIPVRMFAALVIAFAGRGDFADVGASRCQ